MPTYVAEIESRAMFAFRAANKAEAQKRVETDRALRSALSEHESLRRAVWDKQEAIVVRRATPEEAARWKRGSETVTEDKENADHVIVWLVAVTRPGGE